VTQPSRSAAGTTYPNALPSSRPRAAELIDLAGTAQDALEKLIAVSSITQRGRTTGVVTEFVSVWEPLARNIGIFCTRAKTRFDAGLIVLAP